MLVRANCRDGGCGNGFALIDIFAFSLRIYAYLAKIRVCRGWVPFAEL